MTHVFLALALAELTLDEVFTGIPHDGRALVAYLIIVAFVMLTWHGSRRETVARHRSGSLERTRAAAPPAQGGAEDLPVGGSVQVEAPPPAPATAGSHEAARSGSRHHRRRG